MGYLMLAFFHNFKNCYWSHFVESNEFFSKLQGVNLYLYERLGVYKKLFVIPKGLRATVSPLCFTSHIYKRGEYLL